MKLSSACLRVPQERLLIGLMATANSEWMFETTREYVKQRKAFGKTLAHLQVNITIFYF